MMMQRYPAQQAIHEAVRAGRDRWGERPVRAAHAGCEAQAPWHISEILSIESLEVVKKLCAGDPASLGNIVRRIL